LSALTNLQYLYLDNNELSGNIPDLSALTNLKYLYLSSNQLSGNISNLSALTQLWSLDLNHNQLTGTIPDLSALTQLWSLDLNHNQLTGSIPDLSALNHHQLRWLDLSRNQLCGEIPFSLVNFIVNSTDPIMSNYYQLGYWLRLDNNHLTTFDPTIIAFLNGEYSRGENYLDWTSQTPCVGTGTGTITATAEDIISTVAGTGIHGYDGEGIATSKMLGWPMGVAVDSAGNLYIADRDNHRIRKVDSAGNITTVAGTGTMGYDGEGVATSKMLSTPSGVAVDSTGNLYIADMDNHRIRKVDSAGNMTTIAGTGTAGYDDEGVATSKMLNSPAGVAVDNAGNLYIADMDNKRIRKVDSTGNMTTVAGPYFKVCNICSFSGLTPSGVAVDSVSNLFIADQFNYRIDKVDSVGNITIVAGTGTPGYNGEGIATLKKLTPSGVAVDSAGNLFIADLINNRIRN
jgi:sugar lactone lactonase YvrE